MIRLECMCSSALQSWTKYFQMVRSAISRLCFLKCLIIFARSPASANSRTIFSSLSSIKEAKYFITFGWSNCCQSKRLIHALPLAKNGEFVLTWSNWISFMQSSLDLASTISNICTFLRATMDPFCRQVALYTTENWPLPILNNRRVRYLCKLFT